MPEPSAEIALPELLQVSDLKGDLHLHIAPQGEKVGEFTGSHDSVLEAEKVIDWLSKNMPGFDYFVVTDHLEKFDRDENRFNDIDPYGVEHYYDDSDLFLPELARLNILKERHPDVRVISGLEVSIQASGAINASPRVMDMFDVVVASEHNYPKTREAEDPQILTRRLTRALANPGMDILGHPGRRYSDWEQLDWIRIIAAAKDQNKAIEVNMAATAELGFGTNRLEPVRFPEILKLIAGSGAKISIGTDVHKFKPLEGQTPLRFGQFFGIHRLVKDLNRAGFQKSQILNTYSADELVAWAKSHDK